MEDELREKIEKLEKRQATDDATLLIVNRYWTQVLTGLVCCENRVPPIRFVSPSVQACVTTSCCLSLFRRWLRQSALTLNPPAGDANNTEYHVSVAPVKGWDYSR